MGRARAGPRRGGGGEDTPPGAGSFPARIFELLPCGSLPAIFLLGAASQAWSPGEMNAPGAAEPQNPFGQKRPPGTPSSPRDPAPPRHPDRGTECHAHSFLKHLQGR